MALESGKRKSGMLTPSAGASKRPRVKPTEIIMIDSDDDEDDLDTILVRIKQQEASDSLGREPGAAGPSNSINITSDEALALRLSKEWEEEEPSSTKFIKQTSRQRPRSGHKGSVVCISDSEDDVETNAPPSRMTQTSTMDTSNDESPDEKLSEFRDFFTGSRDCSKCQKPVASPRGHIIFKGDTLPTSLTKLLHAPCSSCRTNHCRGCFSPVSCPISCTGSSTRCTITTCCAAGRAIAIFELLGAFDQKIIGERATSDSRTLKALEKTKAATPTVGPGGTGYGTGNASGRGRGQSLAIEGRKMSRAELQWQDAIIFSLNTLRDLLPAPYAETAEVYDLVPHVSIGLLLSLSQVPEFLASLLRNDSVIDWAARSLTYHAMLSLLRRMADCELTVQVLFERRWRMVTAPGIQPWMWGEEEIVWQPDQKHVDERAPPLYDYFKKLIKQSVTFLGTAAQMMDTATGKNQDEQETITQAVSLCGDIIAAGGDVERVMSVLGIAPAEEGNKLDKKLGPHLALEQAYAEACEKLAFQYVTLASPEDKKGKGKGLVYGDYNYASKLDETKNATRNPKKHFRLASELAVMATSLPPGVWVRVDEVRNDAIKFMIAGPEGTPYEGGLFEFDCFMPLEYPDTPPLIHLRTTGAGTVRFNPNLYNDGKVCLSLLGTWPGRPEEQWSSKSTLLQVIVSIQSMILIDVPYFNEPGHGKANLNAPVSINYNKVVSLNTVRWAIVAWLNVEHLYGIWRDVIVSHFGIKKDIIQKRITEWASNDLNMKRFAGTMDLVSEYGVRITNLDGLGWNQR